MNLLAWLVMVPSRAMTSLFACLGLPSRPPLQNDDARPAYASIAKSGERRDLDDAFESVEKLEESLKLAPA